MIHGQLLLAIVMGAAVLVDQPGQRTGKDTPTVQIDVCVIQLAADQPVTSIADEKGASVAKPPITPQRLTGSGDDVVVNVAPAEQPLSLAGHRWDPAVKASNGPGDTGGSGAWTVIAAPRMVVSVGGEGAVQGGPQVPYMPARTGVRPTAPFPVCALAHRGGRQVLEGDRVGGPGGGGEQRGHDRPGPAEQKHGFALVAQVHVDAFVQALHGHAAQAQGGQDVLGRGAAELGVGLGRGGPGRGELVNGVFGLPDPGHAGAVGKLHGHPGLLGPVADDVLGDGVFGQAAQGLDHGGFPGVVGAGEDV